MYKKERNRTWHTLKDSFKNQQNMLPADRKKDEELLKFLVFFLDKHCIYVHKCKSHRFVDMFRSALLDIFSIRSNSI